MLSLTDEQLLLHRGFPKDSPAGLLRAVDAPHSELGNIPAIIARTVSNSWYGTNLKNILGLVRGEILDSYYGVASIIGAVRSGSCADKGRLPAFALGKFREDADPRELRKVEHLVSKDTLVLDFDQPKGDAPKFDVRSMKKYLAGKSTTLAVWISPSGNGLKILVKLSQTLEARNIPSLSAFNAWISSAIALRFYPTAHEYFDRNARDAVRACYIGCDPEIYVNVGCQAIDLGQTLKEWSRELKRREKRASPEDWDPTSLTPHQEERLRAACECIQTEGPLGYMDWFRVGASLWNYGDLGFDLFDAISQRHPDYNGREVSRKWKTFARGSIGPGTVFYYAQNEGWKKR